MTTRLTPRALDAAVVRLERTASDSGKRALILVLNETDRRIVAQIARRLGISSTVIGRATWVVRYAPELVSDVLAGRTPLGTAAKVARARRPGQPPPVERLPGVPADVRIDVRWVGVEITKKIGAAVDAVCELPRPEDVAEILHASADLPARVARGAEWLTRLAACLKGEV
jgi:hypothetical protein